jgi:hypothetical protein
MTWPELAAAVSILRSMMLTSVAMSLPPAPPRADLPAVA